MSVSSYPKLKRYLHRSRVFMRLQSDKVRLVTFDEPTSALDATGQSLFATLMGDHLSRGGLIVAATHAPLGFAARELRIGEES